MPRMKMYWRGWGGVEEELEEELEEEEEEEGGRGELLLCADARS